MKNFILILFALLMVTGSVYCKEVSADILAPKCDYYTNDITKLFTEKYEQYVTGTVCDSQDKKAFIQIKNGLAHGTSKTYYKSGVLQAEANFKNGKLEGILKLYYESGVLQAEVNFKNGKLEGIGKEYDESGALQKEINHKNDKQEGITKVYYESGALQKEVNFKNGQPEGISKEYDENGKLFATITYKNGKAVSGICANGKKWNNVELSNWENGLSVDCGY